MAEPFIAQIKIFASNFAPRGYALCDGQLLQISQFTAVFSLVGAIYGGDGRTTFGLPDLKGRLAMHTGTGPGLTPRPLGQKIGSDEVVLNASQLGSHNHPLNGTNQNSNWYWPGAAALSRSTRGGNYGGGTSVAMGASSVGSAGGNGGGGAEPHSNLQPVQVLNYIFALQGTFPSRS